MEADESLIVMGRMMDASIRNLSVFAGCAQPGGGQLVSDITA